MPDLPAGSLLRTLAARIKYLLFEHALSLLKSISQASSRALEALKSTLFNGPMVLLNIWPALIFNIHQYPIMRSSQIQNFEIPRKTV